MRRQSAFLQGPGFLQGLAGKVRRTLRGEQIRRLAFVGAACVAILSQSRSALAQEEMIYAPVANNDYAATMEYEEVTVSVLANDDGISAPLDPSSVKIIYYPSNGLVEVDEETGEVTYSPDPFFTGYDGFTYTVSDENGETSNNASVMIYVVPDPTPPVIENFIVVRLGDGGFRAQGTASDPTCPSFTVAVSGPISGFSGWITPAADGSFSYAFLLDEGVSGMVLANAVNANGIYSQTAQYFVLND